VPLSFGWPNGRFLLAVGDFADAWYVAFADAKNGIGAFNALVRRPISANTLGQTAKIIGHTAEPEGLIGSVEEATIVHGLASGA
jgi:hypothetical protein